MEGQALAPGMLLDVGWHADGAAQSWVGRVRSVDRTRIVGEPIARSLVLPQLGTFVRVTTAIGSFPSAVSAVLGADVVFERPASVSFSNRRTGLRVRASARGRWWPEEAVELAQAVMLVDISLTGARLVGERMPHVGPGRRMVAEIDGATFVVEVRSVSEHEHPRLAYYGVKYLEVPPAVRRQIQDHVTRARQNPDNWR